MLELIDFTAPRGLSSSSPSETPRDTKSRWIGLLVLRQAAGDGYEAALHHVVCDRHVVPGLQVFQGAVVPREVSAPTRLIQVAAHNVDVAVRGGPGQDAADRMMA